MKRILLTLTAALALAVSTHATDMSKTIRVAFQVDVTGFDPQATNDLYSGHINNAIFDNLFEFDTTFVPPACARCWRRPCRKYRRTG